MNKLQLKELKQALIRKSAGKSAEYVALVKGSQAVVFPADHETRYKHYIRKGYIHVMSALDGDVLPLY